MHNIPRRGAPNHEKPRTGCWVYTSNQTNATISYD